MEKRALGKGLGALIPQKPVATEEMQVSGGSTHVNIDQIVPNRFQPRENFDEQKLDELILSIKEKGVLQPVIVRKKGADYELIAGERRLRAAKILGYADMPVIIKNVDDVDALELSLIENIQRQELNAVEEARAYQRLIDEFGFTQEEVGKAVGKDKTTVSNMTRLLGLPKKIRDMIVRNDLSMGHARALLGIVGEYARLQLADKIIKKGLSVREAEHLVNKKRSPAPGRAGTKNADPEIMAYEEEFQRRLGTKVRVKHGKKRGRIEVEYYSKQDLKRILDIMR